MALKSCSWAQIEINCPNARVMTFGEFAIMAPKSTCPTLTCLEVTSFEALCQAAHSFERLDFYNHTIYRLIVFR